MYTPLPALWMVRWYWELGTRPFDPAPPVEKNAFAEKSLDINHLSVVLIRVQNFKIITFVGRSGNNRGQVVKLVADSFLKGPVL